MPFKIMNSIFKNGIIHTQKIMPKNSKTFQTNGRKWLQEIFWDVFAAKLKGVVTKVFLVSCPGLGITIKHVAIFTVNKIFP